MAWKMRGDQNEYGIWIGELTPEEATSGVYGLWTIGNQVEPGTPGRTDKLLYKTWNADPKKYAPPGHLVIPPVHGDRYEFVAVMNGSLVCQVGRNEYRLSYGNQIDLPPNVARTWVKSCGEAQGITLCRYNPLPYVLGQGKGYKLEIREYQTRHRSILPDYLPIHEPCGTLEWSWCYLGIFYGSFSLSTGDKHRGKYVTSLKKGAHVFIPRDRVKEIFLIPAFMGDKDIHSLTLKFVQVCF